MYAFSASRHQVGTVTHRRAELNKINKKTEGLHLTCVIILHQLFDFISQLFLFSNVFIHVFPCAQQAHFVSKPACVKTPFYKSNRIFVTHWLSRILSQAADRQAVPKKAGPVWLNGPIWKSWWKTHDDMPCGTPVHALPSPSCQAVHHFHTATATFSVGLVCT